MNISVVGISHHTAPVEIRERFALPGDLARRVLRAVRREDVVDEALIVDTCNRTEVYFVSSRPDDVLACLLEHITRIKGGEEITDTSAFYRHDGRDAVGHLFRVVSALDSQMVGEDQILGQVKTAYRTALEERTARFFLSKLMHRAFRVGKRTRTETQLGRGSTSVAQAAVDLAKQIFSSLAGRSVMLVGAGETAELAARALMRHDVASVVVANRTLARAEEVAGRLLEDRSYDDVPSDVADLDAPIGPDDVDCPGMLRSQEARPDAAAEAAKRKAITRAIELSAMGDVIAQMDLVICSTGSPDLVLRAADLAEAIRRSRRALFIVDIAVPRDVDPALAHLPNVFLYNMDDLDSLVAKNIEARRREMPWAEAIIEYEIEQLVKWADSLEVTPTIKLLQRHFARVQRAEIERYGKLFSDGDRENLERFTQGLCKKILHDPIAFLRGLSEEDSVSDQLAAVDMILRMFDLQQQEQDE